MRIKWTDEEGNVYFVDRPTGAASEERLDIRSRPTDPGQTPEDLRANAAELEERCNKYRERQIQFTQNRRIYRMDENGERVYYDEEEMQAARDNVDNLIEKYCD
jgi:hypothetical protein